MERNESELNELGRAIATLKKEVHFCRECFNISDNSHCHVCSDPKRDRSKLLIVEKVTDLDSIEKTGLFKGIYHVLGGSINPLEGKTPETLRFRELNKRIDAMVNENKNVELILATNPNTAGETTAFYIRDMFKNNKGVAITRLGRGLASGSNLEYADELTLRNALEYRK